MACVAALPQWGGIVPPQCRSGVAEALPDSTPNVLADAFP